MPAPRCCGQSMTRLGPVPVKSSTDGTGWLTEGGLWSCQLCEYSEVYLDDPKCGWVPAVTNREDSIAEPPSYVRVLEAIP